MQGVLATRQRLVLQQSKQHFDYSVKALTSPQHHHGRLAVLGQAVLLPVSPTHLMMAQQADKKKSRDVEAITQLRAFEATYKAACKFHGTAPYKPLLALLQQSQDESLPCSKVCAC
jgi:hypothetical protein